MKAGASTSAAIKSLPKCVENVVVRGMSIPSTREYERSRATSAGVSLPIVSMGFLFSILKAHLARESIGLGSTAVDGPGSLAESLLPSPGLSEIEPDSIVTILVDLEMNS